MIYLIKHKQSRNVGVESARTLLAHLDILVVALVSVVVC